MLALNDQRRRPQWVARAPIACSLMACLVLAACGGGGDSAPTPQPESLSQAGAGTAPPPNATPSGDSPSAAPSAGPGAGESAPALAQDPPDTSTPLPAGYERVTLSGLQAVPQGAYAIDAPAESGLTLRLPAQARPGDTLRLRGIGTGRWRLAQGPGQEIITSALPGLPWQEIGPAPQVQPWWTVAASWDGAILMAASNPGQLYQSTDGGRTWTQRLHTARWSAIAISPDGRHIVATVYGEQAWISHDQGDTWSKAGDVHDWVSAILSADGQRIALAGKGDRVHVSGDGGRTWSAHTATGDWQTVASSGDGKSLLAGVGPGVPPVGTGSLWLSDDAGLTWRTTPAGLRAWYRVAMSADGRLMAASDSGGYLYVSSDHGGNWTARFREGPVHGLAFSEDGHQLMLSVPKTQAILPDGKIHVSTDQGQTWSVMEQDRIWRGLAISGDGRIVLAADHEGKLHLSRGHRTARGVDGWIDAGPKDSLELECVGDGLWRVRAAAGTGFSVH